MNRLGYYPCTTIVHKCTTNTYLHPTVRSKSIYAAASFKWTSQRLMLSPVCKLETQDNFHGDEKPPILVVSGLLCMRKSLGFGTSDLRKT